MAKGDARDVRSTSLSRSVRRPCELSQCCDRSVFEHAFVHHVGDLETTVNLRNVPISCQLGMEAHLAAVGREKGLAIHEAREDKARTEAVLAGLHVLLEEE